MRTIFQKLEEAFADAADYEDIHKAILREHEAPDGRMHPDDCRCGDNDRCFVH